ncbi:MAG TPA: hypothetical protein VGD80_42925, partial [Kofleriaceae bacterium]
VAPERRRQTAAPTSLHRTCTDDADRVAPTPRCRQIESLASIDRGGAVPDRHATDAVRSHRSPPRLL